MDPLTNKRILVTGGGGYLGRNLVAALEQRGASVSALDRIPTGRPGEVIADLRDRDELVRVVEALKPQMVFHLAALLKRDRAFDAHDAIMEVNYQGTFHLLQALETVRPEMFVFISTGEIYGRNKAPFRETMVPDPVSPYSVSKINAEMLVRTYSTIHQTPFTILRLFNFFGRGMPPGFFISQLIQALNSHQDFRMTGGEQTRDFLHMDDVVAGIIHAGLHPLSLTETFNLCSGVGTRLVDLVKLIKEGLGGPSRVQVGALPYRDPEIWDMTGDAGKIASMLGFRPKMDLRTAVDSLIQETRTSQSG